MVMEFLDANGIRVFVSAATPLPTTSSGGGGGGGSVNIAQILGAAVSAANGLPVYETVGGVAVGAGNPLPTADQGFTQVLQQAVPLAALNAAVSFAPQRRGTAIVQVTGTFVGTLQLQGMLDGSTYVAFAATPQFLNLNTGAYTASITAPGIYQTSVNGLVGAKILVSAYTSGTAVVSVSLTDPPAMVALDAAIPAGSNNIGSVNIANTPAVASTTASGSPAALNATADGTTDLATYASTAVQITGTWVGVLSFQVSIDGTNWVTKSLFPANGGALATSASGNGMWFGPTGARYFRVLMSSYTSGTAVVTMRYNSATIELPIQYTVRLTAGGDAQQASAMDEVAIGAFNNTTVDRLKTALGAQGSSLADNALHVGSGAPVALTINAASAPASGTPFDNRVARFAHTIQVDVATTTAGTAGTHSVVLEGSLDGTYYTTLATVTPAATSTTATDPSNHANASVSGFPYRIVRARWASIPTSWVGTLTARVVSAG